MIGIPRFENFKATPKVSSPPIATNASSRYFFILLNAVLIICWSLNGLVREVPRMVPPFGKMPDTCLSVNGIISLSMRPFQPFRMPMTAQLYRPAFRTTARMTALSPGQSPPPVSTPIFFI